MAFTRAAVAGLALALAAAGLWLGVPTAGGADSFGYVSQAYLWLDRTLVVSYPPPDLGPLSYPELLTPLGYVPGPRPGTLVPAYPPGLPIAMAALLAIFGTWGPFLVVPASAALLVIATYVLGRRLEDASVGLVAAGLVAFSPAVVYQTLWPMSDVPAAAAWAWCLVAAFGTGRRTALAAGALAGAAVLIRPNLAPLALLCALFLRRGSRDNVRSWLERVALYGLAFAPFGALLGWFNAHLYGSPFRSGYGSLEDLYGWDFIGANAVNYSFWFFVSQGPVLAGLALYGFARAAGRPSLRPPPIFVGAVVASYLPYLVFDAWWYLRFLLPAYPALFVISASAGVALLRPLTRGVRRAAVAAGLVLTIGYGLWFIRDMAPLRFRDAEHRYAAIGTYVRDALPANAAFFTMQHSGALRYYSGRLTVRYDRLGRGWLAVGRAGLEQNGYIVFAAIDADEEAALRERFTNPGELAFLEQPPVAELLSRPRVRIYALSDDLPAASTVFVPLGESMPLPPVNRRSVVWEQPPGR